MSNGSYSGYPNNNYLGQGGNSPITTPERALYSVVGSNAEMVKSVDQLRFRMQASLDNNQRIIEKLARKDRKQLGKAQLRRQQDGTYVIEQYFDDNTSAGMFFFTNVRGRCSVYQLNFSRAIGKTGRYVIIVFEESGKQVICNREKVTGPNLYTWFVEAEIGFVPSIKEKQIKEVLFDYFNPLIAASKGSVEIKGMAGWECDRWMYAENSGLTLYKGMPDLPIQDKHFDTEYRDRRLLESFFEGIGSIGNEYYRIVMLVTLASSVIASFFQEEGISPNYFLNFVLIDEVDKGLFCRLYQVFNRNRVEILEASENGKAISAHMRRINDEVMIVSMPSEENEYRVKKAEQNLEDIARKICKGDCSSMGIPWKIHAGLVVLNAYVSDNSNAVNIITDKNMFTPRLTQMLGGHAVDAFLADYIQYVEKCNGEVREIIKKCLDMRAWNGSEILLKATWEILLKFSESVGIGITSFLKVPTNIDMKRVWTILTDRRTMDEQMILAIRETMKLFYVREKYYGCEYRDECCYYDDTYFWIPVELFKRITELKHISYHKSRTVLVKWKERKLLLPDEGGLTYKLRLDGKNIQTYCFKKELFNSASFSAPIEQLGKEEEEEC